MGLIASQAALTKLHGLAFEHPLCDIPFANLLCALAMSCLFQ
jgi:hypothetical protein